MKILILWYDARVIQWTIKDTTMGYHACKENNQKDEDIMTCFLKQNEWFWERKHNLVSMCFRMIFISWKLSSVFENLMTVFGKTCTGVFETCLVYLNNVWCIWNMLGVFGNAWCIWQTVWCIWNMLGVFVKPSSVFRKPLSVFGKMKFPNTLRHFQIHSVSVFERPNTGVDDYWRGKQRLGIFNFRWYSIFPDYAYNEDDETCWKSNEWEFIR
jgi:hypothetical protein